MVRVDSPDVMRIFHERYTHCWFCSTSLNVEAHHVSGGTKGRSDEFTNLVAACGDFGIGKCHRLIEDGTITLEEVLKTMWNTNRWDVDWVRLALLMRKFLPELK